MFGEINAVGGAFPVDDQTVFLADLLDGSEDVSRRAAKIEVVRFDDFSFFVHREELRAVFVKLDLEENFLKISEQRFLWKEKLRFKGC